MVRRLVLLVAFAATPANFGHTVTVRVRDIDRYMRTVAEIILPDGRNLNQELVRAGVVVAGLRPPGTDPARNEIEYYV
jgi:endonuclease YncB( thermonuclease family)